MMRAVVFAYHDVGVRALESVLARGVEVPLVLTHRDDPDEHRFFHSVAEQAERNCIPVLMPEAQELHDVLPLIQSLEPDFLFSFYYRNLLPEPILQVPRRGALNVHGSLLPKYRGRAPVNWAVLHGEHETGVSLHYMVARADAGDLVAQRSVPILPNDTAGQVMEKVTWAAEQLLLEELPDLLLGRAARIPLNLSEGEYFGRRSPEDGRIDWTQTAQRIHNLVRAVAPPYPGAFCDLPEGRLELLGSHFRAEPARFVHGPCLYPESGRLYVDCVDGERFQVLECAFNEQPLNSEVWPRLLDGDRLMLGDN